MFDNDRILLVGLIELELTARTLRICDGGMIDWPARGQFVSVDPEYGTVGSVEPAAEAIGDEQAGGRMTINVPVTEAAVALAQPEMQGRALRFWIGEADVATGTLIGTPQKMFEGMVDTLSLQLGRGTRTVAVDYVDAGERLFSIREGNVLSSRFHQTAWPGELGFDHCTGIGLAVPWGVAGPPRGSVSGGGFAGGGVVGSFANAVSQ